MRAAVIALMVLLAAAVMACGSDDGAASRSLSPSGAAGDTLTGQVVVFAASSLTDAFGEIARQFQQANPRVTVKFNFAASTALRTQLEQGARADVFASADQIQMDAARKAHVIDGADQLFTKNKLVLIHPNDNPGRIGLIKDLARPGLKLVLTDKNVPIGAYARAALDKMSADPEFGADFGRRVLANLRSEEANVRAVVTKVQLGEADAAIVYASDVTPSIANDVRSILIPDQFNVIATYPIAIVRDAANRRAAQAFIDFVRSASGQQILAKQRFIVDEDTGARR